MKIILFTAQINGEMIITNIDYANNTIDGEFSFIGYKVADQTITQLINCSFQVVPFLLVEI